MNLSEAIQNLGETSYLKRDIIVSNKEIQMNSFNDVLAKDENVFLRYSISKNAKRQICEVLDIPFKFYEKLEKDHKYTLEAVFNDLMIYESKNYLLRTIMDEGRSVIRAFLSDRYKIINNLDVLEVVDNVLIDLEYNSTVLIHEDYLYCNIFFTDRKLYIGEMEAIPTLLVANSEIGDGAFKMIPRITVNDKISFSVNNTVIRKAHLGSTKKKGVIDEDICKDLSAEIVEAIDNYINSELLVNDSDDLNDKLIRKVSDIFKQFEKILTGLGFTEDEKNLAVSKFLTTSKKTAYDIIESVLLVSNNFTAKRREDIESKIFNIVNKLK